MKGGRIALIGDYSSAVVAHQAIDRSLPLAAREITGLSWEWIRTGELGPDVSSRLDRFGALWLVPASPYANPAGALNAITWARQRGRPFLGTCGGFQHALLEYARNVLGIQVTHGETDPGGAIQLISPLSCSLVERSGVVHYLPGTRLREIAGQPSGEEGYHCSFGLNPEWASLLDQGPLRVSARDDAGEVRGVELTDHPFFVATLFQPERRALQGRLHPIVRALAAAAGEEKRWGSTATC